MTDFAFEALVTQTFLDIAHQITHTEPSSSTPTPLNGPLVTFCVDVRGDYGLSLTLFTPTPVLLELAIGMRRGAETDEDTAAVYVTEFFNILCGRLVSSLNSTTHTSARFGIPRVMLCATTLVGPVQGYYYKLRSGPVLLQASYR